MFDPLLLLILHCATDKPALGKQAAVRVLSLYTSQPSVLQLT